MAATIPPSPSLDRTQVPTRNALLYDQWATYNIAPSGLVSLWYNGGKEDFYELKRYRYKPLWLSLAQPYQPIQHPPALEMPFSDFSQLLSCHQEVLNNAMEVFWGLHRTDFRIQHCVSKQALLSTWLSETNLRALGDRNKWFTKNGHGLPAEPLIDEDFVNSQISNSHSFALEDLRNLQLLLSSERQKRQACQGPPISAALYHCGQLKRVAKKREQKEPQDKVAFQNSVHVDVMSALPTVPVYPLEDVSPYLSSPFPPSVSSFPPQNTPSVISNVPPLSLPSPPALPLPDESDFGEVINPTIPFHLQSNRFLKADLGSPPSPPFGPIS
eukprot:TRINITY_DN3488_c0_g1_i1.p1 TRINITY_DN3488_c0_g1~~TRINITY_DN3488_c0_g1_i1.p1  ORF type:complete len:364 (+),score=21.64 TRINITY_DN3488_c0_g1_i1:109-1092(+)